MRSFKQSNLVATGASDRAGLLASNIYVRRFENEIVLSPEQLVARKLTTSTQSSIPLKQAVRSDPANLLSRTIYLRIFLGAFSVAARSLPPFLNPCVLDIIIQDHTRHSEVVSFDCQAFGNGET